MAGQVIGTEIGEGIVAYRYRSTLLGRKILQVWSDVNEEEMRIIVEILNKQLNRREKKEQQNG